MGLFILVSAFSLKIYDKWSTSKELEEYGIQTMGTIIEISRSGFSKPYVIKYNFTTSGNLEFTGSIFKGGASSLKIGDEYEVIYSKRDADINKMIIK